MSVGVCIINRNGVALSADSAGTLTGNQMFYNSMDKVFSLSDIKPWGAITYGNTAIYHVGIDQLLNEFSVYLKDKEISDFFEILDVFADFIKEKKEYYKFECGELEYARALIKMLVDDWGNRIKKAVKDQDAKLKISLLLDELEKQIKHLVKIENYDVFDYVKKNYQAYFDEMVNSVVPELNGYKEEKERFLQGILSHFNLLHEKEKPNSVGVLFAGYGNEDAFPKYINIEIYSVVNGLLKFSIIEKFEESIHGAAIVPLAQKEVIRTFCLGISDFFINYIPEKLDEIISRKIEKLKDADFLEDQIKAIKKDFGECKKLLLDAINENSQKKYVKPLFASVTIIPIPEMAKLAENLVNITSLKRMFSLDGNQQTVGGPTDVATISKTSGFVWIKRKKSKL